jgi:hypothetical protein
MDMSNSIYVEFTQRGILLIPSPRANPSQSLHGQWQARRMGDGRVMFRADSRDQIEQAAYAYAKRQGWLNERALAKAKPANVYDYLLQQLGDVPALDLIDDDSRDFMRKQIPLASACGRDCKKAIDTGKAFLKHVEAATGRDYPQRNDGVESAIVHVVATYIFG